uniref:Uncharacterized protein n=1 Tax=Oryza punctata TaxID=4537 RepID=A0A0E0ML48_ORYPU
MTLTDHVLCGIQIDTNVSYVIQIDTRIPKSPNFCFENFWVDFEGFYHIVSMILVLKILLNASAPLLR